MSNTGNTSLEHKRANAWLSGVPALSGRHNSACICDFKLRIHGLAIADRQSELNGGTASGGGGRAGTATTNARCHMHLGRFSQLFVLLKAHEFLKQ